MKLRVNCFVVLGAAIGLAVALLAGCKSPGGEPSSEAIATAVAATVSAATEKPAQTSSSPGADTTATQTFLATQNNLPSPTNPAPAFTQTPTPPPAFTSTQTSLPSATATSTPPPSPTFTPTFTPTETAIPTPTATRKPTAALSPTPTDVTGALQIQLASGGVLHGGLDFTKTVGGCPTWDSLAPTLKNPHLPYVYDQGRKGEYGAVCVYGVGFLDGLTLNARTPDSNQPNKARAHAEDQGGNYYTIVQDTPVQDPYAGSATIDNEIPVIWYRLWLPPGLPTGKWSLKFGGDVDQVNGTFKVTPYAPQPDIGIVKPHGGAYPADTSPFDRPKTGDSACATTQIGQPVSVYMVNLNPGGNFTVGLYVRNSIYVTLVRTYPFTANRKGNYSMEIQINPDDPQGFPPGHYVVVLILDTQTTKLSDAGPAACVEVVY